MESVPANQFTIEVNLESGDHEVDFVFGINSLKLNVPINKDDASDMAFAMKTALRLLLLKTPGVNDTRVSFKPTKQPENGALQGLLQVNDEVYVCDAEYSFQPGYGLVLLISTHSFPTQETEYALRLALCKHGLEVLEKTDVEED